MALTRASNDGVSFALRGESEPEPAVFRGESEPDPVVFRGDSELRGEPRGEVGSVGLDGRMGGEKTGGVSALSSSSKIHTHTSAAATRSLKSLNNTFVFSLARTQARTLSFPFQAYTKEESKEMRDRQKVLLATVQQH